MDNIDTILKIIERNEAKFVSLKYFNDKGKLQQIDIHTKNLVILDDFILINNLKLRPINNRCFFDPFRSYPTILCLCDNLSEQYNHRLFLQEIILANNNLSSIELELSVNFLIRNKSENIEDIFDPLINQNQCVDPDDQLANLRSEIIDHLEKIGIPTISHYHANLPSSCCLTIKATNFLDMADYFVITNFIIKNVAESYGKLAYFSNNLKNNLFLLFPEEKYNKNLATSIISNIMANCWGSNKNDIYFTNQLTKNFEKVENISKDYYIHDIIRHYHIVKLSLYQSLDVYLPLSYLLIYGFDIKLINNKVSKQILQTYFDKNC